MPTNTLTVQHVEYMPAEKGDGILYVSNRFELAIHLCPCGCGQQSVTPLGTDGWQLAYDADGKPTLYPSIGNRFQCKSHYWVKNGSIEWCAG